MPDRSFWIPSPGYGQLDLNWWIGWSHISHHWALRHSWPLLLVMVGHSIGWGGRYGAPVVSFGSTLPSTLP